MTGKRLRDQSRRVLGLMAVSSACLVVSRLLDDPADTFGGPVLHYVVLAGSATVLVTSIVLLVLRRGNP